MKGRADGLTGPVDGAAFWLDASKEASLTTDVAGDVSAIADARGAGYPVATRTAGSNAKIRSFADKQMVNFGAHYKGGAYEGDPEKYGNASAFSLPEIIATERVSGVLEERIACAAFGPTPETPISISKLRFSSCVEKP